ncbi:MAG: ATP synthase F1 subunit epsilon [Pyrinomonadaceae bacterium]|nr:ATP synthase F1 subunit epsilon [Pyrinomonadaceae bacterium]
MLKLEIVTPERKVVDAEVDSVTVPTASGEAGILSAHAPLISALKPGIVTVVNKGNTERFAVSTGFVEVSNNRVSVLTDIAESAEDVDVERAKAERSEIEKELAGMATAAAEETEEIRERLDLVNARISLTKM